MEGEVLELTWAGKREKGKSQTIEGGGGEGSPVLFQNQYVLSLSPLLHFSDLRFCPLCLPSLTSQEDEPPAPVPSQHGAGGGSSPLGREGSDSQRERPWWGPAWHSSACKVAAAGRGDPSSRCRMVLKPSLYSRRPGPSTCSSAKSWHRNRCKLSPVLRPWPHTALQVCLTGTSSSKSMEYRLSLSPLPPTPWPFAQY